MYDPAKYKAGAAVRICERSELEEFKRTWKYHHKLEPPQFGYAGVATTVEQSFMYHGGDILYKLAGVPGIWHERLLRAV
jgi:hypothetical protein